VKVSRTRGDDAIVASGLARPARRSVTDGQLRLLPGSKIAPK
jgi:hypothetical protein